MVFLLSLRSVRDIYGRNHEFMLEVGMLMQNRNPAKYARTGNTLKKFQI